MKISARNNRRPHRPVAGQHMDDSYKYSGDLPPFVRDHIADTTPILPRRRLLDHPVVFIVGGIATVTMIVGLWLIFYIYGG